MNRRCWTGLVDGGTPAAHVTVHVTIDGAGYVSSAHAEGNNAQVGECLEKEIQTWTFPAKAGATGPVDFPFWFIADQSEWSPTGPAFDPRAADSALAAITVDVCATSDGPMGPGHVSVTFAPSGLVQRAVVDQTPFAGTAVGGCVANRFWTARIPAFAGGSVTVGRSFDVEPSAKQDSSFGDSPQLPY